MSPGLSPRQIFTPSSKAPTSRGFRDTNFFDSITPSELPGESRGAKRSLLYTNNSVQKEFKNDTSKISNSAATNDNK